ncbi:hypothetical protein DE4585_03813 [Mycobacteroides salmoniphilum]|uniref:Uncharacterized protein n=1 Tax=Mycobacteroides salmoniphilum TaxID=404941 RepID=A0A4R8S2P2_9MYCO|nr:hypothetical protein [Mycobacteroides salmoniphilum]TDZ80063.1 hypothetical protein DE4585_03813 [Mycobacteroides salmoniphilum]
MPTRLRAITGTALAAAGLSAALVFGPGVGTASADVLDDIAHEYSTGTSGGQVSNLVRTALQLRARGAQVSSSQNDALKSALDKRPSQMPLINSLKSVIATQSQFLKAAQKPQQPVHIGITGTNGSNNPNGGPPNVSPGPGIGVSGGGGQQIFNENIPLG